MQGMKIMMTKGAKVRHDGRSDLCFFLCALCVKAFQNPLNAETPKSRGYTRKLSYLPRYQYIPTPAPRTLI